MRNPMQPVAGRRAVMLNAERRRRIGWQELSGYGCDRCWWPALAGLAVGLALIAGGVA